jgi:MFS superfamily sulfate permease-like transporter
MSPNPPNDASVRSGEVPRGTLAGFGKYFRSDIVSGFLVFLIALPLCLAISVACGFPAIAGIFTAIIGSIVCTFISNSELTIKGPAAGLIVIAILAVNEFGGDGIGGGGFTKIDENAYRMVLAVGVAAAVLQIVFGLLRAGVLGEFFPLSAVHGMLAAIGVIIIAKQIPFALGVTDAKGEPLEMLREIPSFLQHMNPAIAGIGAGSLVIMFLWPLAQQRSPRLKLVPAPLLVLLFAVPVGYFALDLTHEHELVVGGAHIAVGEEYLVEMPKEVFGMFKSVRFPDFTALTTLAAWKWVLMFFIIGTLESMLSAKAIDMLDPWKRKTNLDRDNLAVGVGNLICALVGGLPMISEIVRSKANIDNGARTRFADMWHGVFLLVCVALIPMVLHLIPLAALASMLIYTGYRLAHPREFVHVYRIGREQLVIFVGTLVGVLATDLLWGVVIGIGIKFILHFITGVPIRSLFKPYLDVRMKSQDTVIVEARYSAVFSNWIFFRRQLVRLGLHENKDVILDLSQTELVDHSVMEKLHELQIDFEQAGRRLELVGLEQHSPASDHPKAARRKNGAQVSAA